MDVPIRGPNILDIFITNRSCLVEECNIIAGITDHEAIVLKFAVIAQLHHPSKGSSIYGPRHADFNLIRHATC